MTACLGCRGHISPTLRGRCYYRCAAGSCAPWQAPGDHSMLPHAHQMLQCCCRPPACRSAWLLGASPLPTAAAHVLPCCVPPLPAAAITTTTSRTVAATAALRRRSPRPLALRLQPPGWRPK